MDAKQTNTDVPACPGCAERDGRIAQLERQNVMLGSRVKQLEQRLEEFSRSAKRQAAPFSRSLPKLDPKKPGRKSGEGGRGLWNQGFPRRAAGDRRSS